MPFADVYGPHKSVPLRRTRVWARSRPSRLFLQAFRSLARAFRSYLDGRRDDYAERTAVAAP